MYIKIRYDSFNFAIHRMEHLLNATSYGLQALPYGALRRIESLDQKAFV
jgi:hypothetical protein